MHVTDWLPTMLEWGTVRNRSIIRLENALSYNMIFYLTRFLTDEWGSCKDLDYGGKPLDGVSHANEERFRCRKFIGRCKRIEN